MTRITVTGAGGFIGQKLVRRLLQAGADVTALLHSNKQPSHFAKDMRIIRADVTAPETLRGVFSGADHVFHLAGCTIVRSWNEMQRVNAVGTANVLDACCAQPNPPQLLFISSIAALGPSTEGHPHREDQRGFPVSHYGKSKLLAEREVKRRSKDLSTWILRPPSVFGAEDKYMLSLYRCALRGWVVLPNFGTYSYSMIHVDDLVDIMLFIVGLSPHYPAQRAFAADSTGTRILHTAFPNPATFAEIARIARGAWGLPARVRTLHLPSFLSRSLGAFNSITGLLFKHRPLLNLDKIREGTAGNWCCNTSRLLEELGYRFQVSMEQRIAETAIGYLNKGWLGRTRLTPKESYSYDSHVFHPVEKPM